MASAHFKAMAYASASLLSLALMRGAAVAETKQHNQALAQAQDSSHQESNLTAEQVQALESDIDRLRTQGRYSEAAKLQHRVLNWREINSGADHPSTATSLNNLAMLYGNQGLYAKAEPLYQRALAIVEKALGPEHPDTAGNLIDLAQTHLALNNNTAAFPLIRRAITAQVRFIQREVPAMPRQQLEQLIDTLSTGHLLPFSLAILDIGWR